MQGTDDNTVEGPRPGQVLEGPGRCQIGNYFSQRSAAHESINARTRKNYEEEGTAEETCYGLTINLLLSILLHFLWGVEKSGIEK